MVLVVIHSIDSNSNTDKLFLPIDYKNFSISLEIGEFWIHKNEYEFH
jgi:hypothetical protein